jgi:hypothetical protein
MPEHTALSPCNNSTKASTHTQAGHEAWQECIERLYNPSAARPQPNWPHVTSDEQEKSSSAAENFGIRSIGR